MSEIAKNVLNGLKNSPDKLTIILIVGGFLLYLFRHDSIELEEKKMGDLVSKQRIDNCHKIQNDSTKIMERLNDTLNKHDRTFLELLYSINDFKKEIRENNQKLKQSNYNIESLNKKVDKIEQHIKVDRGDDDIKKMFNEIKIDLMQMNKNLLK